MIPAMGIYKSRPPTLQKHQRAMFTRNRAKLALIGSFCLIFSNAPITSAFSGSEAERQSLKQFKTLRQNNDQRAIRVFLNKIDVAKASEPYCAEIAGEVLKKYSDLRTFVAFLDAAIKRYPNSQALRLSRAHVWIAADELELAEPDIVKAVALKPDDADAHKLYAGFLRDKGDFKAALIEIDKAISLNKKDRLYYDLKGSILHHLGRIDDAAAAFQKAIELSSPEQEWYARSHLAGMYKIAKRYQEAYVEYDRICRFNRPGNEESRMEMAVCLIAMKKYKEALKVLDEPCKVRIVYRHKLRKECYVGLKDTVHANQEDKAMMQISNEYPWTRSRGD